MTVAAAKRVLRYAMIHPSFRASLRNSPREAIEAYEDEIKINSNDITIEELDALSTYSDDEFEAFSSLAEGLGDEVSGEIEGGVIF